MATSGSTNCSVPSTLSGVMPSKAWLACRWPNVSLSRHVAPADLAVQRDVQPFVGEIPQLARGNQRRGIDQRNEADPQAGKLLSCGPMNRTSRHAPAKPPPCARIERAAGVAPDPSSSASADGQTLLAIRFHESNSSVRYGASIQLMEFA